MAVHRVNTDGLPIGMALRIERVTAGISLTHVAKAVGVSIGQLSRIESGDRRASTELIEKIRVAIRAGAKAA